MTSMIRAGLAAVVVIAGMQLPTDAAHAKKSKDVAKFADLTTDIRDCAKVAADKRDQCISRSRPISGAALMAAKPSMKEKAAAAAAKATAVAAAAVATAKLALAKDGTTDIRTCATVAPELRDKCISRSRPVKGAETAAKPSKAKELATAAVGKVKAEAAEAVQKLKSVFAKDGTTNIADCSKVDPSLRDRCISRSRPVKGSALFGSVKAAANDPGLEQAAKAAAVRAISAARNVFAKDGTTNISDCSKVEPTLRDRCISASRPVKGADLMKGNKA